LTDSQINVEACALIIPTQIIPQDPVATIPITRWAQLAPREKRGREKFFSLHFYAVFTHRLTFFISLEIFVAQSNDSIERSLNVMTVKNGRVWYFGRCTQLSARREATDQTRNWMQTQTLWALAGEACNNSTSSVEA